MRELVDGVMQAQQARADEIQREGLDNLSPEEAAPYLDALRAVRSSVGYFGNAKKVGARSHSWRGRLAFWRMRLRRNSMSKEKRQRVYYETCLFELELDKAAIAYLQNMAEHDEDEMRRHVAAALVDQHQAVIQSITQRLGWTEDTLPDDKAEIVNKAVGRFDDQLDKARRYADEVDASAYVVELEQIGKLEAAGQIDKQVAAQLREDVYLMQMSQV